VVAAAASGDPDERARAFDRLAALYWKPAYKYFRIKWRASNEDAKDLTQAFFARAIERDFEIMLPGGIVGLIVGFATQKYRPLGRAAKPAR
jgi:hypothetical protein